jgi:hypothetical protein
MSSDGVAAATEALGRPVVIPARYNGPPTSANGGYACGKAAALLKADAVEVTLRRPPPLDTPLRVEIGADTVELCDGDLTVVDARPVETLDLDVPESVSSMAAEQASRAYPWHAGHPFPTCFVCGPERSARDGLRIFAGAVEDRENLFACLWTPASALANQAGYVLPEIVWAALDCPSAVAAATLASQQAGPAVLGRLTAHLQEPVRAEQPHLVLSWRLRLDGRKREAGSAILTLEGDARARAHALWIELRR